MPNINEEELWPWEYTKKEGGIYHPWTGQSVTRKQLAKFLEKTDQIVQDVLTVQIDEYKIHCLIFETAAAGFNNYARWDCLNGWTTTIEEAKKKWPEGLHGQLPSWRIGNSVNVFV